MKIKQIIFFVFCIILFCIVFNLYKNNKENLEIENLEIENLEIENFESILKGLNKNKKNKNSNNNNSNSKKSNFKNSNNNNSNNLDFKKTFSSLKSKKTGTTFDDLFKATENMDPDKISIANMQKELYRFNDSFNKTKFKNNSKSTAESFEKFGLYKEKFFEIFN